MSESPNSDYSDPVEAAAASWQLCQPILANLTIADRETQTPCADFGCHELVEHLVGSVKTIGAMGGAEVDDIEIQDAAGLVGHYAEPALAAWRQRGLEGEVPFGDGTVPAFVPVGILGLEFYVHAWDLAQATGQPFEAPAELTAAIDQSARMIIQDDNRGEGKGFAAAVDDTGTDPIAALMAFTGRAV